MWCRVVRWIIHGVSKDHSDFTLRVKKSKNFLGLMTPLKMWGTIYPMKLSNIPEDFNLQQHCCENFKPHTLCLTILSVWVCIAGWVFNQWQILTQIHDVLTCNTALRSHSQLQRCTNSTCKKPSTCALRDFHYIYYHVHTYCIQNFNRENTPSHPSYSNADCTEATERSPMDWLLPYFPLHCTSLYPSPAV